MKSFSLNILTISFDKRGILKNNPEEIIEKLNRDRLSPDKNNFLMISWGEDNFNRKISKNICGENLKSRFGHMRPIYDLLSIFFAPLICKKNNFKPDIVLVYDFPLIFSGFFLKFFWGSKIFLTITNLPTDLLKTRRLGKIKIFYQLIAQFFGKFLVDRALVINEATKIYALKLGISEDKITLFYPNVIGRDKEYIKDSKQGVIREKYGIPKNRKIIFSVGRLEKEKGFERLINNFVEINNKDLVLMIAGRGGLEQKLKELVKDIGFSENIFFIGYVSRKDIWNFYRDADVFILLPHSEALGLVFWEAMYMRVPVIGSTADGVLETIGKNNERGFVWHEKDGPTGLENKIKKFLDKGDLGIETMINRAYKYVSDKIEIEDTINDILK